MSLNAPEDAASVLEQFVHDGVYLPIGEHFLRHSLHLVIPRSLPVHMTDISQWQTRQLR